MGPPNNCVMRSFLIATSKRDKSKYPHPSEFTYELPMPMTNVVGVAFRDFKFGNEDLINQSNKDVLINVNGIDVNVSLTTGNFNNDITQLLNMLNSAFSDYKLEFTKPSTKVVATITSSSTDYIKIYKTPLLRILGFDPDVGLCVYRSGLAPAETPNMHQFQSPAIAPMDYDVYNLSELVVRIRELETILSNDIVTDRSTAVFFNGSMQGYTTKQSADHYIPLLQVQHRLQSLHIKLLNMEGDLYDTFNNEAVFLLELYSQTSP